MSEFKRINDYFKPLSGLGSNNLQDDVANIDDIVISTDTIVTGVHFIGDESPETLAIKLLAVNLSDLASSGAKPYGYTLNLAVPKDIDDIWFKDFADGLKQMQEQYNISLLGGDTVSSNNEFVLSATVFGKKNKNTTYRKNAKVGDYVCLTGKIGGGFYGLKVAAKELDNQNLLKYYRSPSPHINESQALNPYINACIDISDGLVADLKHICVASNVGLVLQLNDIPTVDEINDYKQHEDFWGNVLTGGDDYVLGCTISSENIDKAQSEMQKIGKQLYIIGKTTNDTEKINIFDTDNKLIELGRLGYEHN